MCQPPPHLFLELLSQAGHEAVSLARDAKMVGVGFGAADAPDASGAGAGSAAKLTYARVLNRNLLRPQAPHALWRAGAHDLRPSDCMCAAPGAPRLSYWLYGDQVRLYSYHREVVLP